jgi:hypothetical protein
LEQLPRLGRALADGSVCLDKVVQLTRFVTPSDERYHIRWARRVTPGAVRKRAERHERAQREKTEEKHRARHLRWWPTVEDNLWVEALLPAAEGALFVKTIDRIADTLPEHPDRELTEEGREGTLDQRRADALVALASRSAAADDDVDRSMTVAHVQLDDLLKGLGAELENGPVIDADVARQLICDGRIQTVVYEGPRPIGSGYTTQLISPKLRRLLRHRDGGCVFPGCDQKRFVHGHHIVPWPKGPTNLDNLVLLCKFHHDLVHRYGWRVFLGSEGTAGWLRPDGSPYEPGVALLGAEDEGAETDDADVDLDDLFELRELEPTLDLAPADPALGLGPDRAAAVGERGPPVGAF